MSKLGVYEKKAYCMIKLGAHEEPQSRFPQLAHQGYYYQHEFFVVSLDRIQEKVLYVRPECL